MSISELGSLGEFVGSIAVVITLLYLIFQVRQNTISIRSQSRFHVLESLNQDMKLNVDPTFRDAVGIDDDSRMVSWYWLSMLSHLEMLYFEIVDGALPKTFKSTLKFRVATMFTFPDSELFWKANRNLFTPTFQSYVDTQIPNVDEIISTETVDLDNPYDWIANYLERKGNPQQ